METTATAPFVPKPIENTMNFIVDVSCNAIEENISNTQTSEDGSVEVNHALTKLSAAWTTCTEANSQDPGNKAYLALQADKGSPGSMDAFIATYFNNPKTSVANTNKLSSAFITSVIVDLQGAYKGYTPPKGQENNLSTDLAACNAMNTLISSTSTNETQPLNTISRTYSTMLQQCQSANSSLAGIGDAANDGASSIISLISQAM